MNGALPIRIAVSPKVLVKELDGETVLLDLETDHYYGLDDVGTRMWQLLAAHGEVAAVITHLLAEYAGEVDEETLRRDLAELIGKLAAAGLLTVEGST